MFNFKTLGFAFAYAWIFTVYLCFSPESISDSFLDSFSSFYIFSFATAALFLLLVAVFPNSFRLEVFFEKKLAWSVFCFTGAIFATIGTVWLTVAWVHGSLTIFDIAFIGLTTGLGQSALFLQWGTVFSSPSSENTMRDICVGFLIASLLVCLKTLFPPLFSMIFIALLPLASAYFLVTKFHLPREASGDGTDGIASEGKGGETEGTTREEIEHQSDRVAHDGIGAENGRIGRDGTGCASNFGQRTPDSQETYALLLRTCVGAFIIGIVMGVLRSFMSQGVSFDNLYAVSKVAAGIICCIVIYLQAKKARFEFNRIYRYIMLLMGIGLAILPFAPSSILPIVISRIGVSCFEAFMWVIVIGFVQCFQVRPFRSIGLNWASLTGGLCLGAVIGNALIGERLYEFIEPGDLALVLLFVLFLVLLFVLTERDLILLEGWGVFSTVQKRVQSDSENTSSLNMYHARQIVNDRAHEVAQQYNLSVREEEVLALLALGRSRSQIKSELYLSMGTVNTHISHIYSKMD